MIKNAIAYITRKRNRTFIILIILTIVLSCLYSCLNMMKSVNSLEKYLYKYSNSSISLTKKDGGYFNINEFKDIKEIKELEDIVLQYNSLAKPLNLKVIKGEQKVERDDLPEELSNLLYLEATNNSKRNILFESGVFTIKEGRNIEDKDKEKILIHESLAKKNNLKLHDKIKLSIVENNGQENKRECEYEIIGIFSGKKQEKYTGLSSDFSENMVFVDYQTSQRALNRQENNWLVNKISMFSNSIESANKSLNKVKLVKRDWTKYIIDKNTNAFEESIESVSGIKQIILLMTYLIMLGGLIVLSLILVLWLRERIYEIGIFLSIGINKTKIVGQFIIELLFISFASIVPSMLLGKVLLNQMVNGLMKSDNSYNLVDSLIKPGNLLSEIVTFLVSYGILISIIITSVIIASSFILVKKPKEILSKIS